MEAPLDLGGSGLCVYRPVVVEQQNLVLPPPVSGGFRRPGQSGQPNVTRCPLHPPFRFQLFQALGAVAVRLKAVRGEA